MTEPSMKYHFHHPEKMFTDRAELLEIIAGQRWMTLAMIADGRPYLATMNYGFDAARDCFYFHGATAGKKVAAMIANPDVWGQVIEDRGYVTGKCDHAYRSVHFAGRVVFLEDEDEKRQALTLMIRQMEPDPEPLIQRLLVRGRLTKTIVGRVQVSEMTGKRNALELKA
ncbi:MAG: pyridoxamine 5'-phosphate oxidase family protein [Chloroflexi bacterium]|nr:pyridoxamine 5'-phosphate oxidase family protein [Chloroflexota bacterium]